MECHVCGQGIDAEEVEQEMERMTSEVEHNLPQVCIGCGAVYDENARFVLIRPSVNQEIRTC